MINFWPFYVREVWRSRLQGFSRVALFGAGEHTRWVLDLKERLAGPAVVVVLDDKADAIREIKGIRVVAPDRVDSATFDAVVISSDAIEEKLYLRAKQCFPDKRVIRLYDGLPCGPYDKQGELPAGIDSLPGPADTVNLETVVQIAASADTKSRLAEALMRLDPDPYARRLIDGYQRAVARFGRDWRYVDLWSILYAYARLARPKTYLEIGTRRGHSLAAMWTGAAEHAGHEMTVVCCDRWIAGYAGADNPGPEFVRAQMERIGFRGRLEFLSGSSHELLPACFRDHTDGFDLMTVDGDHSRDGARADLLDVGDHLRLGGLLAFDDINHPQHLYLGDVWREVMSGRSGFETYENSRNSTGIAAAIRFRSA